MDGYVTIGTNLDTKSFDAQIDYIESQLLEIEHKLKQADMGFEVGDTQKLEAQYERLVNQLGNLRKKQENLNRVDLSNIEKSIDNVGNSVSKVIKKVSRWALAVFGIRSAYLFVRQSMSTLTQYNEQLASDVEYIRFVVASAIQPLIENLIQLAYKLLNYINYIAQAWFGVNLFANASAKAMNQGAKSAEKMKKSLAGFDEMNVISDNSNAQSGGNPSFDLSSMQGKIPSWIQWISDNGELLLGIVTGLIAGIVALRFNLEGMQSLGIGILTASIILMIQDIIDLINNPSWLNFITLLSDIAIGIGAIMLVMGNWWGLLVSIVGLAVRLVTDNWENIKTILSSIGNWVYTNVISPVHNFFVELWNGIKDIVTRIVNLFKGIGTSVGNVIGSAFKAVINGVLKAIESILNFPIKSINKLINVINKVPGIDLGTLPTFSLPRLAVGGIVNMPSRGVPIGGAITGESGAEGVIPLTDTQAMETLGATIGKYITINASITNTMNGRVISRELQKINTNNDFAMNR